MKCKKFVAFLSLIIGSGVSLTACASPTAEIIRVVETVVVEKVVEKEGEKILEEIVVTPVPESANFVRDTKDDLVLRINLGPYPNSIDPQKSSFANEIAHLKMIYEGLTTYDENLATIPGAAKSWSYNDDATVLTFTLREGLTYSDGSVLNAERFAYSIRRNSNPETAGEYSGITDEILGAPEWRGCEGDVCAVAAAVVTESVKASHADGAVCDSYEDTACNTLTITLSRPAPYFHTIMGLWVTYPAKEENIAEGGEFWWNSSKYQVGNGPYVLKSLEPFLSGYFTPNTNYWRGIGSVDVVYSYITDSTVAFESYRKNEFDMIQVAAEHMGIIEASPELRAEHLVYASNCTVAVMFHQLKEPFTDQKVREAFAYALDRDAWVREVDNNLSIPTLTWIPPGFPGFQEGENRWGYDPDAALQAVADSSYGSVAALPKIQLSFVDSPRNRIRFSWLVARWKEVFGEDLKIGLNPLESAVYFAQTLTLETAPPVYILGWCADYPDPQNWLSVYWKTDAFGRRIGYSNLEFDILVDQADIELDPVKRADLFKQAQDLLVAGAPVAFMYNTANNYLVKPWVKDINTTPLDAGWPGVFDPTSIMLETPIIP